MKKLLTALLVLGCSLGFVACKNSTKKVELEIPTELVVENQYISFNEVNNASYYDIYYNGHVWTVLPSHQGEIVLDASKIFTEIKTYEVKVRAIGTGKYLDSNYSSSVYYERTENLGVPSIKLNKETLTWTPIDNATSYTIKVTFPDKTLGFYNYTSNTFDIRTILNDVGTYSFQVKTGTGEENVYSTIVTYVYNKKLSTPSNLSLSYDRNDEEIYLYFLADAETVSYTINVNDVDYELPDSSLSTYAINFGFTNYKKVKLLSFLKSKDENFSNVKDFNVCVKAKTSNLTNYENSEVSSKVSISLKDVLPAPTARINTSGTQSTLSWNNVAGATSYTIYKNYEFYTNLNNSITNLIFNKSDLENQIINVQAVGVDGKHNSPLSEPVYLSGMESITEEGCTLSGTELSFDETLDKYYIEVYNQDIYKSIEIDNDYADLDLANYLEFGKYTVKITCYKQGSNPKLITKTLNYSKTLTTPSIINIGNINSMYMLNLRAVEDAIGYAVKINDKMVDRLFTTTKIDLTKYISTVGSYTVQVQAVSDTTKNMVSSTWTSKRTIEHTQQITTPQLRVDYVDGRYILKFDNVAGAYNYTILINYIPVYENDVFYDADGYDITSNLTTAQEYTVMVKANATPNNIYNTDSEYGTIPVKKYIQLDVINSDAMMINNNDGKYWLNFSTQTHAASYDVRIYHIEDEKERKINIKSVPYDITSYIQDSGTYKIYITAVANSENEYLYLSSAESGNPLVYIKNKPTLDTVSGFVVAQKIAGEDKIMASWNEVDNADKYLLSISYTNNYDLNPKTRLIDEVYATNESINLAQYLSKEGQYTIKVKGVSNGEYESNAFATFSYNYSMTVDTDFKRNKVIFNGKEYSHYVTSYEQLTSLLHFYYLYNDINYHDEYTNTDFKLKFMLDPSVTIDMLNVECEKINLGFTNETGEDITEITRMKKLAETAINSYSERVYFSIENPFGEPVCYSDNNTSYYLFNYKPGLVNEKVTLEYTGKPLFNNANATIATQLRRNDNYIFKLELKDKIDVSTTEQLFMAVQAGYAPNFVGNYTTAKTVYDSAKAILNTICTDEMSDYQKVVAIYDWLISNVNYNYEFDELMSTSNSLGAFTDSSNTVKVGNATFNYLESIFLDPSNRLAVSNGISKAFVLLCGLEGIESVKVNGTKNGKYYYWNKVYIDCSPDNESNIKAWYVVDVSGAYQQVSLQDGANGSTISYNVGSYQFFLVSDTYIINTLGVVEKYNSKNAISVFNESTALKYEHNYYANTSYQYEKKMTISGENGLERVTYSGSGTLKYDESSSIEDYLIDILSYMACNAKEGNKYLLEADIALSTTVAETLITNVQTVYAEEVSKKLGVNFKVAATIKNNKILIAISQIDIKIT